MYNSSIWTSSREKYMWCEQAKWVQSWLNSHFSDWLYELVTKLPSYKIPHWSYPIGSRDICTWRVAKAIGNKEIICFVWLYLKSVFANSTSCILLDHITCWIKYNHSPFNYWPLYWLKGTVSNKKNLQITLE